MSWGITVSDVTLETFEERLAENVERSTYDFSDGSPVAGQFKAAKSALLALMDSGSIGTGHWSIGISGHVGDNEFVTVNVYESRWPIAGAES